MEAPAHMEWLKPYPNRNYSGEISSPAVDSSGIYFGTNGSWFFAYEPDGTVRGRFRAIRGNNYLGRKFFGTPALDQKAVYVTAANGTLYALRKGDGRPF